MESGAGTDRVYPDTPDTGSARQGYEYRETDAGTPGSWSVVLLDYRDKIQVIKYVRLLTRLSLKEAKDLVESAPCTVVECFSPRQAENIASQLAEAGARIEIR